MNVKKLNKKYDIKVLTSSAFKIKTPEELPNLHGLSMYVAKRGSGKSVAIQNLVRMYKDAGCLNRVFLCCPTYLSNKDLFDTIVNEEDVYTEGDEKDLQMILNEIQQEADDLAKYNKDMKAYTEMMKKIHNNEDVDQIEENDLLQFFDGAAFKMPEHKWTPKGQMKGNKPKLGCIFDDLQGSKLMSPYSSLMRACVKHRHLGSHKDIGALGCSFFIACQSYKCQGGLNKAIRQNCTALHLWRMKETELKKVMEEMSEVTDEEFMKAYNYSCLNDNEPHSFLTVDFHPSKGQPKLRKNYNEYIL